MPARPARGNLTTALACGLLLAGCTATPEPPPSQPATASQSRPAPTSRPAPITQPPTTGPPAVATLAPAPMPTESSAVTPAFQELRATLELFSREKLEEGASAVLIKAKVGQQEWMLAEGVRTRDHGDPVQPGDRFPVGEQYRSFLAVSVMKLVEEGRLGLGDSAAAYVPGSLAADSPVTIRQLLGADDEQTNVPPAAPGPDAFSLLGEVVEQLRNAPLETVLRTDILTPLNLRATQLLEANAAVPEDLIHGYVELGGETVDVIGTALPDGISTGGLLSTVEELTVFHAALLRGRLLSPESLITMKGTVFADDGLGLDHWEDHCTNGLYYGYTGDIPGYGSVSISSADGSRQLSMIMAYPPGPVLSRPSALALEMTGVAQVALNSGCRFQFR